jgi:hypothetical protein
LQYFVTSLKQDVFPDIESSAITAIAFSFPYGNIRYDLAEQLL